ncbi:helix-turn-helix domain-containing protein [uncultured Thiodictyon sp.]|uniref:response regulator transcription factor n=1 Tax=uncultured Thiodictyon sp. TaxID=1846217 RepID=UPI0025D97CD5|nr:helix-turn-helix domain-containing protein [uncultured Thiodictyon sp.]
MDSGLNIIVVEDHDDLREATVEALRGLGHAARGLTCAEALDAELRAAPADLLVLDLNLPGEDGISLARRMRVAWPAMGIIMVTVREQVRSKIEGYDSGADLYLTKPTSIGELEAAIGALARRLRAQAPTTSRVEPDRAIGDTTANDQAGRFPSPPPEPSPVQRSRKQLHELHAYLTQLEGKLPTLEALAARVGLSARRLNDAFAREYGLPIHAFVTDRRLTAAYAAVRNTDLPLKQLASRLGYNHVNHFNTAFRKKFGFPPGQLRRGRGRQREAPSDEQDEAQ